MTSSCHSQVRQVVRASHLPRGVKSGPKPKCPRSPPASTLPPPSQSSLNDLGDMMERRCGVSGRSSMTVNRQRPGSICATALAFIGLLVSADRVLCMCEPATVSADPRIAYIDADVGAETRSSIRLRLRPPRRQRRLRSLVRKFAPPSEADEAQRSIQAFLDDPDLGQPMPWSASESASASEAVSVSTVEEPPVQKDVTSSPTMIPSPVPSARALPSNDEDSFRQLFPLSFTVTLNVGASVNIERLSRVTEIVMKKYIEGALQVFESNGVELAHVELTAKLEDDKRRNLRSGTFQQTQDVRMSLGGQVRFDIDQGSKIDLDRFRQTVSSKIGLLLDPGSIDKVIQDAGLNIQAVNKGDDEGGIGADSGALATSEGSAIAKDGRQRPSTLSIVIGFILTAIGAAGLFVYAYIFYRKLKKRQRRRKQMRESVTYKLPNNHSPRPAQAVQQQKLQQQRLRQQQQQEQYKVQQQQVLTPALSHSQQLNDGDSSENSSYKGVGSESGSEATDDFAKQLKKAASLDKNAWENARRQKKTTLDPEGPMPRRIIEAPAATKSFPYGDEQNADSCISGKKSFDESGFPIKDAVRWEVDELSKNNSDRWEPYSSRLPVNEEEKKDTESSYISSSDSSEETQSKSRHDFTFASSATIEALERQLTQPELHLGEPDESFRVFDEVDEDTESDGMLTSDIVMEIERLSKFVQRYEKKKERRLKREQERQNRSIDLSTSHSVGSNSAESSRVETGQLSYLQTVPHIRHSALHSAKAKDRPAGHSKLTDSFAPDPTLSGYSSELLSISEAGSDDSLSLRMDNSDASRRLGITPFRAHHLPEHNNNCQDFIGQILTPDTQDETADVTEGDYQILFSEGIESKSIPDKHFVKHLPDRSKVVNSRKSLATLRSNNSVVDRRPGLTMLRKNNAMVDDTSSNVNAMLMTQLTTPSASDEDVEEIMTPMKSRSTRLSSSPARRTPQSAKFNNIRSKFESTKN